MAVYLRCIDNYYKIGKTVRTNTSNNLLTLHDIDYKQKYKQIKAMFSQKFAVLDNGCYLGKLSDIIISFISIFFAGKNVLDYLSKRKLLAITAIVAIAAIAIIAIVVIKH